MLVGALTRFRPRIHFRASGLVPGTAAFGLSLIFAAMSGAQPPSQSTADLVRAVARNVAAATTCDLRPSSSGGFTLGSTYNEWIYGNAMITFAMDELGRRFGSPEYRRHGARVVGFLYDHRQSFEKTPQMKPYLRFEEMWHSGLMPNIAARQTTAPRPEQLADLDRFDAFLAAAPRLDDGTLVRDKKNYKSRCVQIDDLYMVVPYLLRMHALTSERRYLDQAISQTLNYQRYLWNPTDGLYHVLWVERTKAPGAHYWARGNGWFALSVVEMLDALPAGHPVRPRLLELLRAQVAGLVKRQSPSGLWRQVLTLEESWEESSASAMFIYTIARAVNQGWIDASFASAAHRGWKGLQGKLDAQLQLRDVCPGTDMSEDVRYYLNRPRRTGELHAVGPFLLAGLQMLTLENRKRE
jgi:rhamnogalacturonyl hydrolase YesR